MRKLTIMTIGIALMTTVMAAGCATGPKGPTDAELIAATVQHWKTGMEEADTEEIALAISDEFDHWEYGNKEQMLSFLSGAFNDGTLDSAQISLETAETEIDGDTANVYPVELVASFGSATLGFTLNKEADGQWRVTTITVEGV